MKYILLGPDDMDLFKVDGAPFTERYHVSDLDDNGVRELFSSEFNRVLLLSSTVYDRVSKLIHFPVRGAKFNALCGISYLTLSTGCKVKLANNWDKNGCKWIFMESAMKAYCNDTPNKAEIYHAYTEKAKDALKLLTDKPIGTIFGYDYETSGLIDKDISKLNYRYYELQGRSTEVTEYTGKTFHVMGVSICWVDRKTGYSESYYFDIDTIVNGDLELAKRFWSDLSEFLSKHSETCWTYNMKFETEVTYFMFHKFFIFQDAAAVNYIEGRNTTFQSLKVTAQRILKIRSWDDAFDDLIGELNHLLSDAYQVNWDEGTIIQDETEYVWYKSPEFSRIFSQYGGDDLIDEAKRLAAKSFMNPFMCIPYNILGKYCNIDSYSTAVLAKYMYDKYSETCVEVFASNLRFKTYLDETGNYIDGNELKRQRDVANKSSNWAMLLVWQQMTKIEIQWAGESKFDGESTGSEILDWCIRNNVKYSTDPKALLREMLSRCINWDSELEVDENMLHEAFPWDYTYDAIHKQIESWGGLGNIFSKKNGRFWSGNGWIVSEYGSFNEEVINKVNKEIERNQLIRRQEWLWYLCNKIPNWDSEVPEYVTLDAINNPIVGQFQSSDGKPWYDSIEEFDKYAHQWNLQFTSDHPHYVISSWINCGSTHGMDYFKSIMLWDTDGWISSYITTWMKYDDYVFGPEFAEKFYEGNFPNYDIWNTVREWKFLPQRLMIDDEGKIIECAPIFDDTYLELFDEVDTPAGKVRKAYNTRIIEDKDKKSISKHPEFLNVPMYELEWEDHIGWRYIYVDHFISVEHFIVLFNQWWKREVRGYKDFIDCFFTSLGQYEYSTLKTPWDWKAIGSTRLDATGTKLDEIRPILGMLTWRKFRKILGTYLKNLLIEGCNYTKPEYTETEGGLVISEFTKSEWEDGWDVTRGHPRWNCMGVHTKRWCLAGDTPILMADGRVVKIRDMESEVGNSVKSYLITSGLTADGKILDWKMTGVNESVMKVTFSNGLEVTATPSHMFLTVDKGYVCLGNLHVGDKVVDMYEGYAKVESIVSAPNEDVYDIEVDVYHNFFIGTNAFNAVVVHNSSGFHTLFGQSDTKKIVSVPKDKLFFYLDISQAEPRTLAYKSGDPLMKGWYEAGKDIYIELAKQFNPEVVNATWMDDETKKARLKELRGLYKVLVLAIMYGMGMGALAGMTGKPMEVAKKYKKDFLDAMPELEKFIQDRMEYPSWDDPSVKTILGDYLPLYEWDEHRWKRQGINFCIQSFSALVLVNGFENMVRTAIHDGLTFSPIGTVHDSSQMIMDARFIYNCQAHFDLNYTEYLYKIHGVKYKGDIKIGTDYYDLSKMHIVNEDTIELEGSADSIHNIITHLRNAGITDFELNVPEDSITPDYYSSVPKQVARTGGGGAMPDKSNHKVEIKFKDDVLNFHRSLVEGELTKSEIISDNDNLSMSSDEFDDNEETETDE